MHTDRSTTWRSLRVCAIGACVLFGAFANAQTRQIGPGLQGLSGSYANDIEEGAATANHRVFTTLDPRCNPPTAPGSTSGILDQIPSPQYSDFAPTLTASGCNEDAFFIYLNARELFHSANEIQAQGPTIASLSLDQEGLGLALRWTAAEELAAQGSMATQLANGQLATLAARLRALRFGATGFRTVGLYDWLKQTSPMLAQAGGQAAASADDGEEYSPWGGFLNYAFGYGSKAPTALEDAFDFDGSEIALGVDYRLRNNLVVGGILGITKQNTDFDEAASAISVVDGDIESDGNSLIVFLMKQGDRLTLSGSIGTQSLDYDIERAIEYPSFNPNVSSVNSIATSQPQADASTATFEFGYAFSWSRVTLEPFFNAEYMDVTIDAFAENRSINLLSNQQSRRFDLSVSEQEIESMRASAGLRFQYVVTPRFGVIIPYASVAMHKETQNDARTITAGYAAVADILGTTTFALSTDAPDDAYTTFSLGASTILRGGRQRAADGPIVGGLSGFLQFATVENRLYYEDRVMTAGFRYEF